jgi:hypothetical protein
MLCHARWMKCQPVASAAILIYTYSPYETSS